MLHRAAWSLSAFVLLAGVAVAYAQPADEAARPTPALTVRGAAAGARPGDVVALTAVASTPLARARVRAFDRTHAMWSEDAGKTWTLLLGVDVATSPGKYVLEIEGETTSGTSVSQREVLTVGPRTFGVRRLRVDPRFASPPESERSRIEREARRLNEIFAATNETINPRAPVLRPVDERANSNFGVRSVFNGEERGRHNGVDFASPTGTPVRTPASGLVVLAEPLYFTGNTVVIDHGQGLYSLLAHLDATSVTAGSSIDRGAVVGTVGATGRATGPHLHWSVRLQGARVDPLTLLPASSTARDRP